MTSLHFLSLFHLSLQQHNIFWLYSFLHESVFPSMFLCTGFPLFFIEIYWNTPAHLQRLLSEGTPLAAHWKKGTKPCHAFLSAQLSTLFFLQCQFHQTSVNAHCH